MQDSKYVLMDRNANFICAFRTILDEAGVEPLRLPAKSPNLNANLERFHLSIKSASLSRMIFFGEQLLRRAVNTYLIHYHGERNHQGLGNKLIDVTEKVGQTKGEIECHERLGGSHTCYRCIAKEISRSLKQVTPLSCAHCQNPSGIHDAEPILRRRRQRIRFSSVCKTRESTNFGVVLVF